MAMHTGAATRELTSLGSPHVDWVALAHGMGVPGVRVDSVNKLVEELQGAVGRCNLAVDAGMCGHSALERPQTEGATARHTGGAFLIHACLA